MTLKDLKPGDLVILTGGGWLRNDTVEKVEGVTPTKITVRGQGYRPDSGFRKGKPERFDRRGYIRIPIDGEIEEVRNKTRAEFLALKLSVVKWKEIPLETLKQIDAILSAPCSTTA